MRKTRFAADMMGFVPHTLCLHPKAFNVSLLEGRFCILRGCKKHAESSINHQKVVSNINRCGWRWFGGLID
jgi:hypothetical protein